MVSPGDSGERSGWSCVIEEAISKALILTLISYSSSYAVIVMKTVVTDGTIARRMVLNVYLHVEIEKALHVKIWSRTV